MTGNQRGVTPSASADATGDVKAVIVKRNDTLWKLSQKYSPPGATAENFRAITSLNNISNPDHIEAGQRLLLPVEPKGGTDASTDGAPPALSKSNSSAGASPRR
jgi:nucleoid-associated protein YgaU